MEPTNVMVDRTGWPSGPWDSEPDHLSWTDEETGLPCLITRNRMGYLCGYVAVEPGHPLHGVHYDASNLRVHNDVTYSANCQDHVCHVPEPGKPDNVWWFGFACIGCRDATPLLLAHFKRFADVTYKDWTYVENQVRLLAIQLKHHDELQVDPAL